MANPIYEKVNETLRARRTKAEILADQNMQEVFNNAEAYRLYCELNTLNFNYSKAKFSKLSTEIIERRRKDVEREFENALTQIGISAKDLEPQYSCNICKDSGWKSDGKKCSCFTTLFNSFLREYMGVLPNSSRLKDCELVDPKIVSFCANLCEKYPNTYIKSVVLTGYVGTGKTNIASSMANEFVDNGFYTLFIPSIKLSDTLLSYHLAPLSEKKQVIEPFEECDVLIIDDLGTEPMLKNVTIEYLLMLISSRLIDNKLTIITTNLNLEQLNDRYGERIFSRLADKKQGIVIEFTGEDLRIKQKP